MTVATSSAAGSCFNNCSATAEVEWPLTPIFQVVHPLATQNSRREAVHHLPHSGPRTAFDLSARIQYLRIARPGQTRTSLAFPRPFRRKRSPPSLNRRTSSWTEEHECRSASPATHRTRADDQRGKQFQDESDLTEQEMS